MPVDAVIKAAHGQTLYHLVVTEHVSTDPDPLQLVTPRSLSAPYQIEAEELVSLQASRGKLERLYKPYLN